jgi:voltage-gated potassium channel
MKLRNQERLERFERQTDIPLMVLAAALIPLIIVPWAFEIDASWEQAILWADWGIWAAFALVFGVKLAFAPHPFGYVREHWLEASLVALPFLRPLRLARVLRFARVAVALGLNVKVLGAIFGKRAMKVLAGVLAAALVGGGGLVFAAERQADGATITSFQDGVWWALVTMTTVGYGDFYPTTALGRSIGLLLMVFGVAALAAVTAEVAAMLIRNREDEAEIQLSDVMAKLDELQSELAALRAGKASS